MSEPRILLVGAGGHCRSCVDVLEQEGRFEIAGVVDRLGGRTDAAVLSYPFIGTDADLAKLRESCDYALVTVGQIESPAVRIRLFEQLSVLGFELPCVISPRAYVSAHAEVGKGTIVMHDALVNAGVRIGVNCIINTKALVEHDSTIGDHCHVSTAAIVNGSVQVASGTFLGSNATIVHGSTISANSFVRAASLELGE